MSALAKWWRRYWFAPAPLLDLAVCKNVIVGFQLWYILTRDYLGLFERLAALPDALYDPLPALLLFLWPFGGMSRPSLEILQVVFWLTVVTGIGALIGFKTSINLLLFASGNVFMSAFKFSFGELHHADAAMMVALVVLALSPAGQKCSVDERQQRAHASQTSIPDGRAGSREATSPFARWPLLVIRWMLVLAYLSSARWKLMVGGPEWVNGDTLQYYLFREGLQRSRDFGVWLAQFHPAAVVLSWMTLLFEGTFWVTLVIPRAACFYVPFGMAFHTIIYLAMNSYFFPFVALYAAYIPWTAVWRGLRKLTLVRQPLSP